MERNSGIYLLIGVMATVGIAFAAYIAIPEVEERDQPLAVTGGILAIGFYGLYLWLQIIRRSLECPADDWLVASILLTLVGAIGLMICMYGYFAEFAPGAVVALVVTGALLYVAIKRYR